MKLPGYTQHPDGTSSKVVTYTYGITKLVSRTETRVRDAQGRLPPGRPRKKGTR